MSFQDSFSLLRTTASSLDYLLKNLKIDRCIFYYDFFVFKISYVFNILFFLEFDFIRQNIAPKTIHRNSRFI